MKMWAAKILAALAALPQGFAFAPRLAGRIGRRQRVLQADGDDGLMSWQESLEKVLNPFTGLAEKQVMVQDLIARREEVVADVSDAVASRSAEKLFPEGTQLRRAASGAAAVQRQVAEDVLPALLEEPAATLQSILGQVASRAPALALEVASALGDGDKLTASLGQAVADPNALGRRIKDEVQNVLSSTPVGLAAPPYTLVTKGKGFEVRDYASFTVVRTAMGAPREESPSGLYQGGTFTAPAAPAAADDADDDDADDADDDAAAAAAAAGGGAAAAAEVDEVTGAAPPAADDAAWTFSSLEASGDRAQDPEAFGPVDMALAAGDSFNRLAGYIFGDNDAGEALEMTTPVATSYKGKTPSGMSLYLAPSPATGNGGNAGGGGGGTAARQAADTPSPTNARVYVSRVVPQRAAVRAFQGFATDGEIKRQLLELKASLAMAGLAAETGPNGEDIYQVLQYNPPWTVPVLRSNEIAVRLRYNTSPEAAQSAGGAWAVPEEAAAEAAVDEADYDDGCPSD